MSFAHGGNVYEIASRLGCSPDDLLDYSASINPLGPPPGLADQFNAFFHRLQHYPDIANRSLLDALAAYHGLPSGQIVVGNGSTELIYWLPRVLGIQRAAVVLPTFSEYRKAFELQSIHLLKVSTQAETGFQPVVEDLDKVCREAAPEAILFTHPGSPSGTLMSQGVREWIKEKSRGDGPLCIVDEVFVDFCEDESLKRFLKEAQRLVLIRSMTKFYGIPGLRLGYLLTSEFLAERLRAFLPPWSVNTLAQMAGVYCLNQTTYRKETLGLIERERDRMLQRLGNLQGIRAFPAKANYVLLALDERLPPAGKLQHDLLSSERIIVRDCVTFEGLSDRYVRLAIRLPEQNDRLLDGLALWVESNLDSREGVSILRGNDRRP